MIETTPRSDAYQAWRARLAAKQEERRAAAVEPAPEPAANPRWDPAAVFEPAAPEPAPEPPAPAPPAPVAEPEVIEPEVIELRSPAIDLRNPAADRPAQPRDLVPGPALSPSRRRALAAREAARARRSTPSVADALRQLNDERLAGTISEAEFKARKAELFS